MPYRRLPNTDKARLRALQKAYRMLEKNGSDSLPFSEATLTSLRAFLPSFQNAMINLEAAKKNQVRKNTEHTELVRKARMYVSHYIHVMNFAIIRGELKATVREFYELETYGQNLPPLNTENDLLEWGKKIIDGDQKRIMHGGSPIYNPSIALVKVHYEKFADSFRFQKTLQSTTARLSTQLGDLRQKSDQLILDLWNETEASFEHLPDHKKRMMCEPFGLVYVYRKSEKERLKAERLQSKFSFE
ncbi:hypothetical protein [Roseimarinus sediminis]|uniref:hypothetical protein n=1 Tax=Roseimarinus sediminis TaxID=1610899 RepID=UPI003D1F9EEA